MTPYTDYIVRLGDLKRAIIKNPYDPNFDIDGYMRYLKYNTPSAEPKTGKWIAVEYNDGTVRTECSVCGYGRGLPPVRYYCPNCGAKMEVQE